jgi:hypothetical protein
MPDLTPKQPLPIALVRRFRGEKYFDVDGATCQVVWPGKQDACGGNLMVEDHGGRGEFRYELFCEECMTCDPNGWATRAQVIEAARKFK